jgi:hypothetical protein
MTETYVSTDVETDGPIPGPHSMLSIGSAAFNAGGKLLVTFSANLVTLPGGSPHPKNLEFWQKNPQAWEVCRRDPQPPEIVMPRYAAWLKSLPGSPVFVGYPVAFDFMFVYWYLMRFAGECPLHHNGIDVRTYAMAMLKRGYRESGKADMPRHWFGAQPGMSGIHSASAQLDKSGWKPLYWFLV